VTSVFEPPQPPAAGPSGDHDLITDEVDESPDVRGRQALPPAARAFFDWVIVVGVALFVAIMVRTFLLAHFVVDGDSMRSTLHTGDRVFVNKLSYRLHDPNRGDVVVLHEFEGARGERDLIKRVIALENESIEIRNCEVYIDEDPADSVPAKRLLEPYLDPEVVNTQAWCEFAEEVVPDDHVFVMGDNRPGSSDSRDLGPIPVDDIVGRAFVVFWPKPDWQWL
jgi:signal peptidase I